MKLSFHWKSIGTAVAALVAVAVAFNVLQPAQADAVAAAIVAVAALIAPTEN